MGVKKKKEDSTKLVSKILIVGVCLLFVGLMVTFRHGFQLVNHFYLSEGRRYSCY